MKRLTWFVGGVVAGAAGVDAMKRKVKATASKLSPAQIMRTAGDRARRAAVRGGDVVRAKERELVARAQGRAVPLSDEVDDVDTVIVDGKLVEPGKVVILRQSADRQRGLRRRGA